MWGVRELPELDAIGEKIMQREYRNSIRGPARLVAQPVIAAPREPGDSWPAGRPGTVAFPVGPHGDVGLPARDDDLAAGRASRRATRDHATSQIAPAIRPPQTALTINTGKR